MVEQEGFFCRMPVELHKEFAQACQEDERSKSGTVRFLVKRYLDERKAGWT